MESLCSGSTIIQKKPVGETGPDLPDHSFIYTPEPVGSCMLICFSTYFLWKP